MSPFEFLLALYVILAGFGLTLLVRSVGQIIEARSKITLYWIHTAWLGFIFVIHLTSWFAFWRFRTIEDWSVLQFLLVVSIPAVLYLVSHICVPEVYGDNRSYDMRAYFYERHRVLLGLLALAFMLMFASEWLLIGFGQFPVPDLVRGLALLVVIIGCFSDSARVHAAIVIILLGLLGFALTGVNAPLT